MTGIAPIVRMRDCAHCGNAFEDPGPGRRKAPAGYCKRSCAEAAKRAVKAAHPLRDVTRRMLFGGSGRDWTEARAKVDAEAKCRACGAPASEFVKLEAAHVIARAQGGTDDPLGIVPLCRHVFTQGGCHALFDAGRLDLGGALSREEEAHAVALVGLEAAYRRVNPVAWRRAARILEGRAA